MEEREISIFSAVPARDAAGPPRHELLSMVKKHSNFLGDAVVDEQDSPDIGMDEQFWHEMLDLYFIRGRVSNGSQDDDLIFFVRNMAFQGYEFDDAVAVHLPFFVRRWASKLEKVFGDNFAEVDWRRTFYLNLIAHTSFTVTVAICSISALHKHQSGEEKSLSPIYKVVKTVYASPSRVNFQLDFKKDVETLPAYPNICFAVDDFDDTFGAVVLSDKDHCYCVLLNAHGGAAFPGENRCSSNNLKDDNNPKTADFPKVTLFSGFVSYQMVREAFEAGKSRLGSLLSLGHAHSKPDMLHMRGPGGRGEVEVAVYGIADQSCQNSGPALHLSKSGSGFGTIVHRAASTASVLAKQAYSAASTQRKSDAENLPLKCCLMSISLPWEHIAHDLLFKMQLLIRLNRKDDQVLKEGFDGASVYYIEGLTFSGRSHARSSCFCQ